MGPQPDPGHDAERALGTEEQLGEVGPDGGGRRAAGAHDGAVGEHDLEPDDEVLDLAVPRRVLAGTATGHPAADGRQVEALREVADAEAVPGLQLGLEVRAERAGQHLDDARQRRRRRRCRPARSCRAGRRRTRAPMAPHTPLRPPAAVIGTPAVGAGPHDRLAPASGCSGRTTTAARAGT